MKIFKNLTKTQKRNAITGIIIFFIILSLYIFGVFQGKEDAEAKAKIRELEEKLKASKNAGFEHNPSEIPSGWNPTPLAVALHNAMLGFGTDEQAIWNTLDPINSSQIALVDKEFTRLYYDDYEKGLMAWFESELSGDDLTRAMRYFANLKIK